MKIFFKHSLHLIVLFIFLLQAGCASPDAQKKTATPVSTVTEVVTSTQIPEPSATVQTLSPSLSATFEKPTLEPTSLPTSTLPEVLPGQQGIGFGAYLDVRSSDNGLALMNGIGSNWVHEPFYWSAVERQEGIINWRAVAGVESKLKFAALNNLNVILYINDTPGWALKDGYTCGAVAQDKFAALATFLTAMVQRYTAAPFNVQYYELWSEQDVSNYLGCWGDPGDLKYYGGAYYGEMLKVAYPAIKAANPYAQVLFGGLLMDCDSDYIDKCGVANPPEVNLSIARFLDGALAGGAGPYFDGISFHAYDYYAGAKGTYGNSNWGTAWNTTGPVVLLKAAHLREVLAQYQVTGKYLMNTEVALLCGRTGLTPVCITKDHQDTVSAYIVQTYAAGIASRLFIIIWFSAAGWRGSALFDTRLAPLPSSIAFQYASSRLLNATFIKAITDFPGIQGYEYNQNSHRMWVLWSVTLTDNPHIITLSDETVSQTFDMYGGSLGSGASFSVGLEPVYFEFSS